MVLIEFWETKNHKYQSEKHIRIGEFDTINNKNTKILNIFILIFYKHISL